ncbi:hypothetical protein [Candidatus Avelusimicrobium sp.]|uniref:hypothetical protein n=1 Tax=Candidatus Avelusimicrobium sp. TaxID=3048833 RepID=UPI003D7C38A7
MKKLTTLFIFVFAVCTASPAFAQSDLIKKAAKANVKAGEIAASSSAKAGEAAVRGAASATSKVLSQQAKLAQITEQIKISVPTPKPPVPAKTSRIASVKSALNLLFGRAPTVQLPPQVLREDLRLPVQDFSAFKTDIATMPAETPWKATPQDMYRALSLPADGAALRNIMENGLLLKDVGKFSNNRTMAYVSGDPRMVRTVSSMRFNSLASDPNNAVHYAKMHHSKDIIVVVRVQGLPEHEKVAHVGRDIPAENIKEVIAALNIGGNTVWCRVEATPNGFTFTPYLFDTTGL